MRRLKWDRWMLAVFALSALLHVGAVLEKFEIKNANNKIKELVQIVDHQGSRIAELQHTASNLEQIGFYSDRHTITFSLARTVLEMARIWDVSPDIAFGIMKKESNFKQSSVGSDGEIGIMQIKLSTARWLDPYVTRKDLFDLETNIRFGLTYLLVLLHQFDNDLEKALRAYNVGPSNADRRGFQYARDIINAI